MDQYLSVKEIASAWAVSEKTVRELVKCGRLSGVKIAGVVRVSRAAVEAYLAGQVIRPPPAPIPLSGPARATGRPPGITYRFFPQP